MSQQRPSPTKSAVREHWESETCGVRYGQSGNRSRFFHEISEARYALEPFIAEFADFEGSAAKDVLEIGVGAGSDFERRLPYARSVIGIDLTQSALDLTRERLDISRADHGQVVLARADAESLPFADTSFDFVYSWGVLHHTPNTPAALSEALRVLRPGGKARIMVYHVPSWTGLNLSLLYGVGRGRWLLPQKRAIFEHLESPGTKAYSKAEFRSLLEGSGFTVEGIATKLGPGDLLQTKASQRYQGRLFRFIWRVYPRWLVRMLGDRFGLYLMAKVRKPLSQETGGR